MSELPIHPDSAKHRLQAATRVHEASKAAEERQAEARRQTAQKLEAKRQNINSLPTWDGQSPGHLVATEETIDEVCATLVRRDCGNDENNYDTLFARLASQRITRFLYETGHPEDLEPWVYVEGGEVLAAALALKNIGVDFRVCRPDSLLFEEVCSGQYEASFKQ